jgi:hypothetical protein
LSTILGQIAHNVPAVLERYFFKKPRYSFSVSDNRIIHPVKQAGQALSVLFLKKNFIGKIPGTI